MFGQVPLSPCSIKACGVCPRHYLKAQWIAKLQAREPSIHAKQVEMISWHCVATRLSHIMSQDSFLVEFLPADAIHCPPVSLHRIRPGRVHHAWCGASSRPKSFSPWAAGKREVMARTCGFGKYQKPSNLNGSNGQVKIPTARLLWSIVVHQGSEALAHSHVNLGEY